LAVGLAALWVSAPAHAESNVPYSVDHSLTQLDTHTVRIDSFMTFQIEGVR